MGVRWFTEGVHDGRQCVRDHGDVGAWNMGMTPVSRSGREVLSSRGRIRFPRTIEGGESEHEAVGHCSHRCPLPWRLSTKASRYVVPRDRADLGISKITVSETRSVPLLPIVGGLALVGGIVLIGLSRRGGCRWRIA